MIHYIRREDLHYPPLLRQIYADMNHDYYWSDDFSKAMYVDLAEAGFISVSTEHDGKLLLLAEIQKAYAILEFDEMHISKKVSKLLRKGAYRLAFDTAFDDVIRFIQASYDECWMVGEYAALMRRLHTENSGAFKLFSTELYDAGDTLVAGEIGYITGNNVYTSLSGFHNREPRYRNWGTLQLVLLGKHLQSVGIRFWNLGHPYMEYKRQLGARILLRSEFLHHWYGGSGMNMPYSR